MHFGTGCPICHEPVGFLHTGYCTRRGVVKAKQFMYYIEFNLTGIEGYIEHRNHNGQVDYRHPVYHKGRWPKLFPTREDADKFIREREHLVFLNKDRAGIRSLSIMGVMVDV